MISVSIDQLDELDNVKHGVGAVVWMLYLALRDGDDADPGNKTARCVYELLEPWDERLGDLCGEFEANRAEVQRMRQERKEQEDSKE